MAGKFVVRKTGTGIKFDLKAANGEIVLSSEVYSTPAACRNGINSVRENAPDAPVEDQTATGYTEEKNPKFEIYLDGAGAFRFRLKAKNGQIIGAGEGYKSKAGCQNGIESVRKNAADAVVEEDLG